MNVVKTREEVKDALKNIPNTGFVPTMGALHNGHLSLIEESAKRNLYTVCSIFVNPTQFNKQSDLNAYPNDVEGDLAILRHAGCDLVFVPTKEEIYGTSYYDAKYIHDFGLLETSIEGAFRPGHFKGVAQVVHILFEIIEPKFAFFGEKDYQQLQIIKKLVKMCHLNTEIIGLPTVREEDGLAMSSRNRRLSRTQREHSTLLSQALTLAARNIGSSTVKSILDQVNSLFDQDPELDLEYFYIVDTNSFEILEEYNGQTEVRALIAAHAGDVRLIDNMRLA